MMVDVDTAMLAGALGVPCELPEDEPAVCRGALLASWMRWTTSRRRTSRDQRVQAWVEGVRLIKRHFGDEVYVRGNCDQAPFSLACLLRGMEACMMDLRTKRTASRPGGCSTTARRPGGSSCG